jgi:hypothetical protein
VISGVALAMVNLVTGNLLNVMSGANIQGGTPDNFMDEVSKNA